MKDILHAFGMVAVIAIAVLCTLVQLSDVSRGFDRLGQDRPAVSQPADHHHQAGTGRHGAG